MDIKGGASGSGSVTSVSIVSANGFAGSVATSTSTPAITLSTSITGLLKGNGTAISAAAAGTDYQAVIGNTTALTVNSLTIDGNISSAAWTTNGIRIKGISTTITDTTSSGTVATAYTNRWGGSTIAASSAVTYTDYFNTFIKSPVAGSNVTFTNAWSLGLEGPMKAPSITLATGTITTSQPVINATQTWNASGVTFTGLFLNVTNTASASDSLLMDLQIGGSSKFKVDKAGVAYGIGIYDVTGVVGIDNSLTATLRLCVSGLFYGTLTSSAFNVGSGLSIGWSSTSAGTGSQDLSLFRDAADTLAQRRGTNAQTARIYGTYTDSSNYRRLTTTVTTGGLATLKVEGAGTGASPAGLNLGSASTDKVAFFGVTPVVQPATGGSSATIVNGSGTAGKQDDTYDGYTLAQVVKALRNLGILT